MNLYFTVILPKKKKIKFFTTFYYFVCVGMCISTASVWRSEDHVCPGIDLRSAGMIADLYLLSQLQGCHPIFKLLYLPISF